MTVTLPAPMKPIIILPPDTMSDEDKKLLNENGLCVVVAKDPGAVRFVDPIPAISSRNEMEHAAIQLSRRILHGQIGDSNFLKRDEVARYYVTLLTAGTSLDAKPTQEEREQSIYRAEREEEVRRLARADAKAERDAKKAQKAADKSKAGGK